ncbi:MAG: class I SAM-dependent methyltransferase [Sedimentisphaerales bacterium]|nr:class I SAM-dependent methyltransferase [Sedimentisphaerales bacterium]
MSGRKTEIEIMPNWSFRMMAFLFRCRDFICPYIDRRIEQFEIKEGMTVVDYGCGPGRYTTRFARLAGDKGKVYAVDIHKLAIDVVTRKKEKGHLENIEPILANGYDCSLPDHTADIVCALDMFFAIKNPGRFLEELRRITKPDGLLIIDDGHQRRSKTKQKLLNSGYWDIIEETRDHLKCRPRYKQNA